jgi:uncharacterized protein (TIGR02271 family)
MLDKQGFDAKPGGSQFQEGTPIYDVNGDKIGTVSQEGVEQGSLVLRKGLISPKHYYVPTSTIHSAGPDGVYLNLTKDQVLNQAWGTQPTSSGHKTIRSRAGDVGNVPLTPTREGEVAVPVREEELVADKERSQIGQVHVHKDVVEERQTISEPVMREQVRVERTPVDRDIPVDADAFQEKDIDLPVMGEQLSVEKQAHVAEEVHLHKQRRTEQQRASDTVRKERVTIEGEDDVIDRGDVRP